MANQQTKRSSPDKTLAAVCGLFCPVCTLFIGTNEDPARLQAYADRLHMPVEELECQGCRSDKRGFFCRSYCKMTKCAKEKGIDFCIECRLSLRRINGFSGAAASPQRIVAVAGAHQRSWV